ncbi:MAG: response regulator [Actinomycetota bacterium]
MISVLICDDHPATARGLARLLELEAPDLKVVGVTFRGEDAVEMARELSPEVVVMDIYMPGLSGIEATRRIIDGSADTRVVMFTVSDLEVDVYEALRAGATGYLTKCQDVIDLIAAIRGVRRGQLTIPAGIVSRVLQLQDAARLTEEERVILRSIAQGKTNRQIGEEVHLSERTVRRRVRDIYAKLRITDPSKAAAYAAQVSSLYRAQAAIWSESARRRLESAQERKTD